MSIDDDLHDQLSREIEQFARSPERFVPRPRTPELVHLLAAAAERTRSALLITDADLDDPGPRIVWANQAFEELTGWQLEEVVGRTPRILQGPATDRAVLDLLRAFLEGGDDFEGEAINYRKDGTPFVNSWRIDAIRDGSGTITHFVAVQDDVTTERIRELVDRRAIVTLQAALLPPLPERVGAFEVGSHHRPAPGATVGGDWCDLVPPDSDDGTLLAVVGDVTGHGTRAIASMGQLRWATQFAVLGGISLADTLRSLRRLAALQDLFATLLLVEVEPDGFVRFVCAGHPPAVIVQPDGGTRQLTTTTPLIGLPWEESGDSVGSEQLGPGEVLVGYTDGLIERRGSDIGADIDRLLDELPGLDLWRGTADEVARRIVDHFAAEPDATDDTAVLVLRRDP